MEVVKRARNKRKRSLRSTAKWMEINKGVKISKHTVARTLKDAGYHPGCRSKRQKLTPKHQADRVTFCQKRRHHNWKRTLMTDETDFTLYRVPNTHNDVVWIRKGESAPAIELIAHPPIVKLWAGASRNGRTQLHFYPGSMNATKYKEMLTRALPEMQAIFGTRSWTFQHDGASAHKAAKKMNGCKTTLQPSFLLDQPENGQLTPQISIGWRTFGQRCQTK